MADDDEERPMAPGGAPRADKDHATKVRDFAYHLLTYAFVCTLLVIVDVRGGTLDNAILGLDWAFWVMLFWGFGLLAHAIWVFVGTSGRSSSPLAGGRGPDERSG